MCSSTQPQVLVDKYNFQFYKLWFKSTRVTNGFVSFGKGG